MKRYGSIVIAMSLLFGDVRQSAAQAVEGNPLEQLKTFADVSHIPVRGQRYPTFVLGEPVYLWVVMSNWSPILVFQIEGDWHPANNFEIIVTRQGDLPKRFTAGLRGTMSPSTVQMLEPHQMDTQRLLLCYHPENPSGMLFDRPGHYTIDARARLTINGTPQVLNLTRDRRIEIEIVEAVGDSAKIVSRMMRPDCAEDLQLGYARKETLPIWQEVIQISPSSVWALHAKMLLAWYDWRNPRIDYLALAGEFEKIGQQFAPHLRATGFMDNIYYGMAACYDRAGDPVAALRWLLRLQKDYPASPLIGASGPMFKKYIYFQKHQTTETYSPWYLSQ